ncbi:beta-N-acetylhexosaminidase [Alkalihalobacillus sp. AL-G]|uniref:beta-N-acetylhexosaminidase n=1 Tax=Alkalihalobacillus sp. AL-G TaxID=2926399 RepID=UPI00272AEE0F|nr:beta-N-acetylhexosaminidase [Alkalihalobacillus sp. AL-G]WLD91927.1 beta-N-acetylhexosaminidase [Alkalihalobacillus sp. AL-G]
MSRRMKKIIFIAIIGWVILSILGIFSFFVGNDPSTKEDAELSEIEARVEQMTVKEKVGQLLMPAIREVDNEPVTNMQPEIKQMIDEYTPGGIVLFRENVQSRQQLKLLISKLQEESEIPLLMSIDQEGGLVTRLSYFPDLPGNMALGATADRSLVKEAGQIIGKELHSLGIHIDFAPAVDINVNPLNPVIGIRSFGDDPKQVAKMGTAFMDGLNEAGVMAVAKHFPGHGGVASDSHYVLPVNPNSIEELRNSELKPFQAMIDEDVQGVMTAHITFPNIETTQLASKKDGLPVHVPATLSPRMINELLREEMRFDGLVFTDAMDMKAISDHFGPGEAAVRTILAGADIIVMPEHLKVAYDSLIEAVESKRVTEKRLNKSVMRILKAKQKFIDANTADLSEGSTIEEVIQLEKKIAEQSITVLKNDQVLPLEEKFEGSIAIVSSDNQLLNAMKNAMWGHHYQFELVRIDSLKNQNGKLTEDQIGQLEQSALTLFVSESPTIVGYGENAWELATLKDAQKYSQDTVLVMARNPYDLTVLPEVDVAIAQYSTESASFQATADVIFGEKEAFGTLPVQIPTR